MLSDLSSLHSSGHLTLPVSPLYKNTKICFVLLGLIALIAFRYFRKTETNNHFKCVVTYPNNPRNRNHKPIREWTLENVKGFHIENSPFMMHSSLVCWSRWSDGNIMPSMEGLTTICLYLKEKHHFSEEALFVCNTLQIFSQELIKIQNYIYSEDILRRVFIVPSSSTAWGKNRENLPPKREESFVQHIVAIGVEKRGAALHVFILDPMIRHGNEIINPKHIGLGSEFENVPFSEKELILSYIVNAGLNHETTQLYHSAILREKSNGCWAFALKDAIAFLKSPTFFDVVKFGQSIRVNQYDLKSIETLPANFMLTAQFSHQEFDEYFSYTNSQDEESLRQKVNKHYVEGRNLRIGHATVKWMKLIRQKITEHQIHNSSKVLTSCQ